MLTVLCWGYERVKSRINLKAGNKININSFLGPYLKYFSRDKRIALAPLGQYFLSREKYFYVRTEKRVNIIIIRTSYRMVQSAICEIFFEFFLFPSYFTSRRRMK